MNCFSRNGLIASCVALAVAASLPGCAHYAPDSPYLKRYQAGLQKTTPPATADILAVGLKQSYPKPIADVWTATLKIAMQYEGVLAVESNSDSHRLLVIHGQQASVSLPAFARPVATGMGAVPRTHLRMMDAWLAIAVVADGPSQTRIAVAWVHPETGKATAFESPPAAATQSAAAFGGSSQDMEIAAAGLSNYEQQVASALSKEEKRAESQWKYAPQATAKEFMHHLSVQLYGEEIWLRKFRLEMSNERGLAADVKKEDDPGYPELEKQHGQWCSAYLRRGLHVVECPKMAAVINDIIRRLQAVTGQAHHSPNIFIVVSNDFNAFTVANGDVFVCTGLLDKLENNDQLAFVLAHECDHFFQHDAARKIKNDADTEAVVMSVMIGASLAGGVGGALVAGPAAMATSTSAMVVSELVTNLATQTAGMLALAGGTTVQQAVVVGYSKDTELRADANGFRYAYAAGYNPQGAFDVLAKIKEVEVASKASKMLSLSHLVNSQPGEAKRLEKLKEYLPKLKTK